MLSAGTGLVRRRRGRLSDGRRRASQRGAVAVETALVTPVLIVVLLGIIELPMLIRDYVAVTSAARTGARVGSAAPAATAPNSSGFVQLAADAVGGSGGSLPAGSLKSVLVYKANSDGFPGSLTSVPSSCGGISSCVTLTWSDATKTFTVSGGSWASSTVNACFPNAVDSLGVAVIAEHKFLSGLIGTTLTMSDRAVMNFEPLPVGKCASGSHS